MTNLILYICGVPHPFEQLSTDFSSPFGGTMDYETLFSSTGIHHDDHAHIITLEMLTKGF